MTGFDTSLTYEKLCRVCDHVRAGLPYIATHPDYNCPTEDGFIPDIGSFHELIHASAFRYPDHVVGKPSGDIMDYLGGACRHLPGRNSYGGGSFIYGCGSRCQ